MAADAMLVAAQEELLAVQRAEDDFAAALALFDGQRVAAAALGAAVVLLGTAAVVGALPWLRRWRPSLLARRVTEATHVLHHGIAARDVRWQLHLAAAYSTAVFTVCFAVPCGLALRSSWAALGPSADEAAEAAADGGAWGMVSALLAWAGVGGVVLQAAHLVVFAAAASVLSAAGNLLLSDAVVGRFRSDAAVTAAALLEAGETFHATALLAGDPCADPTDVRRVLLAARPEPEGVVAALPPAPESPHRPGRQSPGRQGTLEHRASSPAVHHD